MSQKRQKQPEEGTANCIDDKRLRKSHSSKRVVLDVMNLMKLQNLINPVLEPLVRRVVKEEVDSAFQKFITSTERNCEKDILPSQSRSLELRFLNPISLPVFTGTRIEGEGCTTMEIALVDVLNRQVISSGFGSSAKVEIVVLEGDFDGDEENWTFEEFANNIVREREGKKPLLNGDVIVTLKDGTGLVGDMSFTDNSSWTRSRKFRLGARLIEDIDEIRIREAKSEPFVVRDHRGELYKKHHPPSLSDEVWRLEKISKDGAFHKRLRKERVDTVKDFLIWLSLDPTRLRHILGSGMSAKKWETTVEHARTCVLDKTLHFYNASTSPEKNGGVVFNVVGQVMGIFLNGHYVTADKMTEAEKANARELVFTAYGDREKIVTFDESSLNIPSSSNLPNAQPSSVLLSDNSYHQDSSSHDINLSSYSQKISSPDYMQSLYSIGGSSISDYYLNSVDPMEIRFDQPLTFPGRVSDSTICDTDSMARAFCELSADLHSGDPSIPRLVPLDKAQKGWNVLVCVLRWRSSIKRIVAGKTRVRPIPQYHDIVSS